MNDFKHNAAHAAMDEVERLHDAAGQIHLIEFARRKAKDSLTELWTLSPEARLNAFVRAAQMLCVQSCDDADPAVVAGALVLYLGLRPAVAVDLSPPMNELEAKALRIVTMRHDHAPTAEELGLLSLVLKGRLIAQSERTPQRLPRQEARQLTPKEKEIVEAFHANHHHAQKTMELLGIKNKQYLYRVLKKARRLGCLKMRPERDGDRRSRSKAVVGIEPSALGSLAFCDDIPRNLDEKAEDDIPCILDEKAEQK
jgi:hypothetical protein